MFLFNHSHEDSELAAKNDSQIERRGKPRYPVSSLFQATATLTVERGKVSRLTDSGTDQGSNWKCRLLDCSEQGVRVQLEPSYKIPAGELRDLRLKVQEFSLSVPCRIANINEQANGAIFGLTLDFDSEAAFDAYWQLLEVVVLGSSLKLHTKTIKPDESGYFVEHYECSRPARLSIWRHPHNQEISAFEFRLKRQVARAIVGSHLECMLAPGDRPVPPAMKVEIQRLFSWIASNLSPSLPLDVREVLQQYTVVLAEGGGS